MVGKSVDCGVNSDMRLLQANAAEPLNARPPRRYKYNGEEIGTMKDVKETVIKKCVNAASDVQHARRICRLEKALKGLAR